MKSILIIRPGAIGDALLAFPVLKALRERYAGTYINLVSNAQVLPLAIAYGIAEQTFDFQDIQWSELFSSNGIRTAFTRNILEQTDLAICWMRDFEGIIEHNLKMSGAKRSIIAPGRPAEGERLHIVDYLSRTVGLSDVRKQFSTLSQNGNPISKDITNRCVAIHPGSGAVQKCWPISRFATVIRQLWEHKRPVLLLAGPADTERMENLLQQLTLPYVPGLLKILTNAPLLEVAQHLQQCAHYLGNDSGITHLAAMLGVSTLAIFVPTDPAIWQPVGQLVTILQGHTMQDVSVDAVMGAISSS